MLFILQLCVSWKIKKHSQMSELCKYWLYEMKFDSLNGEDDGECSGVGFVEIS